LHFLTFSLWPNLWYILENIPWASEKNVQSSAVHGIFYRCLVTAFCQWY
jgi:hypothetical protein